MDLSRDAMAEDLFAVADDRQRTVWLFLRLLGVIAFLAFLSFHLQLPGLIGEEGVMPVDDRVDLVRGDGTPDLLQFPSLLALISSDAGLTGLTLGGMAASVLLVLNIAPALALVLLWFLHMSVVVAGGPFTEHQTDILLTETLFVGILLAPRKLLPGNRSASKLAVDVMLLVLAKLMIFSGVMKLAGSSLWRDLGAVQAHLVTQPLPSPLAWYASQLPGALLQLSTLAVLGIELVAPLLLFSSRRYRIPAAWSIIALQLGIIALGSFGLLNVLTILLCILAFDDAYLTPLLDRLERFVPPRETAAPSRLTVAAALAYLVLSVSMVTVSVVPERSLPGPILDVADGIDETRTINRLGVYAHLPDERKELVVEGRWNGSWERYRFRMKPDDPHDPPPRQQLLLPRLDLWMTDEAHRDDRSVWFTFLMRNLQDGNDRVEALFERVPADRPPDAVRAVRRTYRFTSWEERQRTGRWWDRSGNETVMTVGSTDDR